MNNNEINGYTSIALSNTNIKQRVDDMGCKFRHSMLEYVKNLEKERRNGDLYARYGRILHASRNSQISQDRGGLCYPPTSTKQNAWVQSGRFLESQQKRTPRVPCQQEKHSGQKIKATYWWHSTTKDLAADTLLLTDCSPRRSKVWNSLPCLFSITRHPKEVKLYETWVCDRKEVYP